MREAVELIIRGIHLIAAIIWFGGVIFSSFIVMPILRQNLPSQELLAVHNRFRHCVRLMVHILLITGAMVFFSVSWNDGFSIQPDYMLTFIVKFATFGVMALFWGVYSFCYQRHLEAAVADGETQSSSSTALHIWRALLLIAGLIVFGLALGAPQRSETLF